VTFRRRSIAGFVLLALVSVPCLGLCAGWQTSSHARMACCVESDGDQSQARVDACCATGETRQNADSFVAAFIPPLPITDTSGDFDLSVLTALQDFAFDADRANRIASETDRHLLLSVFLI
jgi:hypothetical protein